MILELIAVSVSCLIMTLYLTAYINSLGVPASISATYYKTEKKWIFPTAISLTGLCALVPLMNHTPENYQFVAFFIVAATLFVASAPAFREEMIARYTPPPPLCLVFVPSHGSYSQPAVLGLQ